MKRFSEMRVGVAALAILVGGMSIVPSGSARFGPEEVTRVTLTLGEVEASNEKVEQAYGALVEMWREEFRNRGERFSVPRLVRYRAPIRTSCGTVKPGNAAYCLGANTIYFDDVFVAGQAKRAAHRLGTDGDMAGIGVIAHEMGHAVAFQLGYASRYTYLNEAAADCLAGAFAGEAHRDKQLESGDLEEAEFGMYAAGQPLPQPTGNSRVDARRQARAALMSHGTPEQRQKSFRDGYEKGAGVCFADLKRSR